MTDLQAIHAAASDIHITSLADKAMLVKLTRGLYDPYAYDAVASERAGGAEAGRYNKRLLKNSLRLQAVTKKFNDLYVAYNKNTVPWMDDGVRMISSARYFEFASQMRDMISDAMASVPNLVDHWDEEIAADKLRFDQIALGNGKPSLFNPLDYPTAEEVRSKFHAAIRFAPIPTTDDFRVAISEEDKQELQRQIAETEANITKHLLNEMLDPVSKFVHKMSVPIGHEGHIFRNTMIENLVDVVTRLPKLNINDDPQIGALIKDIEGTVLQYAKNPDVLRESPVVRDKARKEMEEIQAKMSAFMGVF